MSSNAIPPPPSFDAYPKWLASTFKVDLSRERNRFEREKGGMQRAAQASKLWSSYQNEKRSIADGYLAETTYALFVTNSVEELVAKPWESLLHKSYRINVSQNTNWPEPPNDGWLEPSNWFERVHDIVRTTIIVKYLDGVTHITEALAALASAADTDFECDFEARDTGYYAAHIRAGFSFGLLDGGWQESTVRGRYEIQVTTQLQEVIRRLTHQEYEMRREQTHEPQLKWQWDYTSDSFKPNYLGHILHYMEGMIMEVRDRGRSNNV